MQYRRPLLLLTALVLALLAGCDGDSVIITDPDGDVPFQTLLLTQFSDIDRPATEIIDNSREWEDVWDEIGRGGPPPTVDFSRDMVALVAAGERPNGCYSVEITSINLRSGFLRINADVNAPGSNCVCPAVIVQPVHAVRLPRTSRSASFDVRQVTQSCR